MEPEIQNPYAPPTVAPMAAASGGYDMAVYHPAGNGKRFLNLLVDVIMTLILIFVMGVVMGLAAAFGMPQMLNWLEANESLGGYVLAYSANLIYYVGMEGLFGLSVGKLITGTRVVDSTGRKAGIGKIIGRTLARFVPFEVFSFLGGQPGGWHDHWSGTVVIDVRNRQPALAPGLRNIYNR